MPAGGPPCRLAHTCALGANPQLAPPRGLGKNVLPFARLCPQMGRKLNSGPSTPGLTPRSPIRCYVTLGKACACLYFGGLIDKGKIIMTLPTPLGVNYLLCPLCIWGNGGMGRPNGGEIRYPIAK